MSSNYNIIPIGWIHRTDETFYIEIEPQFSDALLGIDGFSHIMVFYWFHENDHHKGRSILQVHPRGNPDNPLCGVFATHAPVRPNLIAFTPCQLIKVEDRRLYIDQIDARNGSPVIDIKSYISYGPDSRTIRVPDWV